MGKDIRKEYDGRRIVKHCIKQGAGSRMGKGDHCIVSYKNSSQVVPLRPLGHGLQAKIVKWMVGIGLAVFILTVIL